ncbi:protein FAM156A/FAM156B-like [Phacochoerus africanus]|uniref:protein FAM156A/FAM156B-like n=1 Tax=Phacochoerus africanus TaxID=41426 RepID=UPI001FD9F94B|nr:protein FAM156A/FAM156B-like [Phacochoerus africanus]XP_047620158.1 protein FAM156A/FAM156B-like [Phacochoerus africanus]
MDPSRRITPTLKSESSLVPPKETSQEVTSTSQPSFSQVQSCNLTNFNRSPSSKYLSPLPQELRQEQYRDEMAEQEKQWEKPESPQRKKTLVENKRQKTLNYKSPFRAGREGKISSLYNKDWNKCKCHYCQIQKETVSGNPEGQNSSSWKTLVQDLSQLNLSPDTTQARCVPEEELPHE